MKLPSFCVLLIMVLLPLLIIYIFIVLILGHKVIKNTLINFIIRFSLDFPLLKILSAYKSIQKLDLALEGWHSFYGKCYALWYQLKDSFSGEMIDVPHEFRFARMGQHTVISSWVPCWLFIALSVSLGLTRLQKSDLLENAWSLASSDHLQSAEIWPSALSFGFPFLEHIGNLSGFSNLRLQ